MLSVSQVLEMLQSLGGYGTAGLMYYFWQQERLERLRYRDQFETVLKTLPELTRSLEDLTDEVSKLAQKNLP